MKKKISLCTLAVICFFGSCTLPSKSKSQKELFVSILPLKYFADKIAGDIYKVEVMVPPGAGPETYSPTPRQMRILGRSDAFFAIGFLGFEVDLLEKLPSLNPKIKLFKVSKGINLIQEKEDQHADHIHLQGVDPHIWSSPKEATSIARNIYEGISEIDPGNKDHYLTNLQKLIKEINTVDSTLTIILSPLQGKKFIIFHPALGYLARDYYLEQFSIEFEGKVPSPKHMQELIEIARKEKINTILIQKEFDKRNAEIVAQEIKGKVVQIDPLDYNWPLQMISIARSLSDKAPQ